MTKQNAKDYGFARELNKLIEATKPCNEQMHEPDEQGVTVEKIVGNHLDNACGPGPNATEFAVGIRNEQSGETTWHNLSTIIALARLAKFED